MKYLVICFFLCLIGEANAQGDTIGLFETTPVMPGCIEIEDPEEQRKCTETSIIEWVQGELKPERVDSVSGTVFVGFVIDTSGVVTDVEILRGIHPALDRQAAKAVESLPQMKPGEQNGKPIPIQYTIPVKFVQRDHSTKK
ncbi:energy transducer TonB [Sanyastnella coralliicola]|uniref:energy transducer TonB n=1 Tax=Sanyastnella coralliicola TaxID=3069118 RepID=UPI0027B9FCCA|nr:energy transducer TonB [Longitalea sp. SCSIO 12813]